LLEQRQIVKAEVEIGWQHMGVEKLLETASPTEAIELVRSLNPLAPNWFEHTYRLAAGMDPLDTETLREETRQYHLYFIRKILEHLEEDHLLTLSHKNLERFRAKCLSLSRLNKRLSGVGQISLSDAISFGFSGPSLKACQEPLKGDTWSRFLVKMAEIHEPSIDLASEGFLMMNISPDRVRIRTPGFAHAAALSSILPGNELDDLVLILLSFGLVGTEIDR
jgi:NADH:ubiquinone oxidoreductase subunit D